MQSREDLAYLHETTDPQGSQNQDKFKRQSAGSRFLKDSINLHRGDPR